MGGHAIDRAKERFNLELNADDLDNIRRLIKDGKSELIERQEYTKEVHRVFYKAKEFTVVYRVSNEWIVTVLLKKWDALGRKLGALKPPRELGKSTYLRRR